MKYRDPNLTLEDALSFIDTGSRSIMLSNIDSEQYFYHDKEDLQESDEYEKLSKLSVSTIDVGSDDDIIFYTY